MNFSHGSSFWAFKSQKLYVLCVRSMATIEIENLESDIKE
jgi:hypothetical protein